MSKKELEPIFTPDGEEIVTDENGEPITTETGEVVTAADRPKSELPKLIEWFAKRKFSGELIINFSDGQIESVYTKRLYWGQSK